MQISFKDRKKYSLTNEEGYRHDSEEDETVITIERGPRYNEEQPQNLKIEAEKFWKLVEAAKVLKNED